MLKFIFDYHFFLQNLPALELLDISYNSLRTFDFDYFDQVGTLRHLTVNASHNNIMELIDNVTSFIGSREQGNFCTFLNALSISSFKIFQIHVTLSFQGALCTTQVSKFLIYLIIIYQE